LYFDAGNSITRAIEGVVPENLETNVHKITNVPVLIWVGGLVFLVQNYSFLFQMKNHDKMTIYSTCKQLTQVSQKLHAVITVLLSS
jgi:hypothetical protein